jgi:hypothetical protein
MLCKARHRKKSPCSASLFYFLRRRGRYVAPAQQQAVCNEMRALAEAVKTRRPVIIQPGSNELRVRFAENGASQAPVWRPSAV